MRYLITALLLAGVAAGYPLDGGKRTGIRRLAGYQLAQEGKVRGPKIPPGGLWPESRVRLHLTGHKALDVDANTPKDPVLQKGLEAIVAGRSESYGLALLDITDPAKPRYAAVRESIPQLPGSVGKLLIAGGMMGALARRSRSGGTGAIVAGDHAGGRRLCAPRRQDRSVL